MMFFRNILYDIKNGFISNYRKYIIAFILIIIFYIDYCIRFVEMQKLFSFSLDITISDFAFYIFAGSDEFIKTTSNSLELPALWTLFLALILYLTLHYPFDDLSNFGKNVLINSRSRYYWWFSKCVWIIASVSLVFIFIYFIAGVFTLIFNARFSADVSIAAINIAANHEKLDISLINLKDFSINLLLPYFTIIALSLMQFTISLITRPILSYIVSMAHLIITAFYMTPYIPGNYAMLLRNSIINENGINLIHGILVTFIISTFSMLIGAIIFKKYDILNKE